MIAPFSGRLSYSIALLCLACALGVCANNAAAFPLTMTINQPNRTGTTGSTESFSGTITNNSGADILASDLFLDFSGFDPKVISLSQLLGSPDFLLANGASSATVELFKLEVGSNALPGARYVADVFAQDGNNPPDLSNLLTVSVLVPEPNTVALIAIGLLALLFCRPRRR